MTYHLARLTDDTAGGKKLTARVSPGFETIEGLREALVMGRISPTAGGDGAVIVRVVAHVKQELRVDVTPLEDCDEDTRRKHGMIDD